MSWALKGLNGPLKDVVTPFKPGLSLGRQGDLVIQDTKASSIHARLSQVGDQWFLEDNNSKNGVRVKGAKVGRIELIAGTVFYIGDQGFEILAPQPSLEAPEVDPDAPTMVGVAAPLSDDTLPPIPVEPPPPPKKTQRLWNDVLATFLNDNAEKFTESVRPVAPLVPALVLDFVRGNQTNSRWVIGYGPRKVGASVLDLPIWDAGAPAVCFEILPSADGIVFKTMHPDIVTLNGQSVDNQVLRVGDTIRILETIIEVDFIE